MESKVEADLHTQVFDITDPSDRAGFDPSIGNSNTSIIYWNRGGKGKLTKNEWKQTENRLKTSENNWKLLKITENDGKRRKTTENRPKTT